MQLTISSDHFTWNPETRTFAGEASELEHEMRRQKKTKLDYQRGQLGFHMVSKRTGRMVWFYRVKEHRDAEGEVTYVEFRGWCGTSMEWLVLKLFND